MTKNYDLTDEQRKAVKKVEQAMKAAHKLGVHFFDNYGRLTAYNGLIIKQPVADRSLKEPLNESFIECLSLDNFHNGNADDDLFVERL